MSKFGSLSAPADQPFRVVLIDPATEAPLKDTEGQEAFIDVLSSQSDAGRKYDRERTQVITRRAMKSRSGVQVDDDQFEANVTKLARLTKAWRLVDPATKQVLDVPCSPENAAEFYAAPLAFPFFVQVWTASNETANFMRPSSQS